MTESSDFLGDFIRFSNGKAHTWCSIQSLHSMNNCDWENARTFTFIYDGNRFAEFHIFIDLM